MIDLIGTVARSFVSAAKGRRNLALENLALRHQVSVLQRQSKKQQLNNSSATVIGCFGWGYGAFGPDGNRRSALCSPQQS